MSDGAAGLGSYLRNFRNFMTSAMAICPGMGVEYIPLGIKFR
jgi:hypothetical protein